MISGLGEVLVVSIVGLLLVVLVFYMRNLDKQIALEEKERELETCRQIVKGLEVQIEAYMELAEHEKKHFSKPGMINELDRKRK